MSLDLIIRNGTVIDGTGEPRYRADVAIAQGRIVEVGKVSDGADLSVAVNLVVDVSKGGVNAAIEVGKQRLVVQLGSQGEQFSEANAPRAIKRIAKQLS